MSKKNKKKKKLDVVNISKRGQYALNQHSDVIGDKRQEKKDKLHKKESNDYF